MTTTKQALDIPRWVCDQHRFYLEETLEDEGLRAARKELKDLNHRRFHVGLSCNCS